MGRFYASGDMHCDALDVVYSCVCRVMGVSVKESVMHVVMKKEYIIKFIIFKLSVNYIKFL